MNGFKIVGLTVFAVLLLGGLAPFVSALNESHYDMITYIGGYLNQNPVDNRTDPYATSPVLIYNPSTQTNYKGRRVTNNESSLAFRGNVYDAPASRTYLEEEQYYFYAQSAYDASVNAVLAKNALVGYEDVFTDPIILCTNSTPPSAPDEVCPTQFRTSKHRLKIKFLGTDWVIDGLTGFAYVGSGGTPTVKLGKEVQYREFMQIGDSMTAPNGVRVTLTDIFGMPSGSSYFPAASFAIYDANGNLIGNTTLTENGTDEYNTSGIILKLWKAFVGTGGSSYAQASIFSDKLVLTSGSPVDFTNNSRWQVNILQGGPIFGASLSKLQLYQIIPTHTNGMAAGEYVNIIENPAGMRLTYNGLEIPTSTDILNIQTVASMFLPLWSGDYLTQGNVVTINSNLSNAFGNSLGSNLPVSTLYFVVGRTGGNASVGDIFYYYQGFYRRFVHPQSGNGTNYVDYAYQPGGAEHVRISFNANNVEQNTPPDYQWNHCSLAIPEIVWDNDSNESRQAGLFFDVGYANSSQGPVLSNPNATAYVGYSTTSHSVTQPHQFSLYESGLTTWRGSVVAISPTSAQVVYPLSLVHAKYSFANLSNPVPSPSPSPSPSVLPSPSPTPQPNSCNDTDGGLNYFVRGNVSGYFNDNPYNYMDYCASNAMLREYYCNGTISNSINYTCSYGCANGACLKSPFKPTTAVAEKATVPPQTKETNFAAAPPQGDWTTTALVLVLFAAIVSTGYFWRSRSMKLWRSRSMK